VKIWSTLFFGFFLSLLGPANSYAFPDQIRHGYVNCTACHASPTGGGALTAYGRELSRELLSTWGKEGESDFAYFIKEKPEWLILGGDMRSVYTYRNNPKLTEGKWIFMQMDLEAYANWQDKFFVGGTVGFERVRKFSGEYEMEFLSRRHWINYRPTDTISFRAGKFNPAFGINVPDHIIVTKRGLGWDQQSETYNAEASFLGENWNHYITGIFGRPDSDTVIRDKGVSLTSSYSFAERYKVGASYHYGSRAGARRHVVGPWALLGFTKKFYVLTETNFESRDPRTTANRATKSHGVASYTKFGYELVQGWHLFFTEEVSQLNFQQNNTRTWGHTIGTQWFPRPHLDFLISWQKLQTAAFPGKYTDFAWLQIHFYL
jgi:hypothetical protein